MKMKGVWGNYVKWDKSDKEISDIYIVDEATKQNINTRGQE